MFPYLISKYNNLRSLKININDSYDKEIEILLKHFKININNFHFLDFFYSISSLNDININFNSFNSKVFKRVLFIINNNPFIKKLSLNLFPENEKFTKKSLLKICRDNDIASKSILDVHHKVNGFNNLASIDDEIISLVEIIISEYKNNLDDLSSLIDIYLSDLIDFSVSLELPGPLVNYEKLIQLLHNFIFGIFISMNTLDNNLQSLEINASNLEFDGQKYPLIAKFLEIFKYCEENSLINFSFDLKLVKSNKFANILPSSLKNLTLNQIDCDILKSINEKYQNNKLCNLEYIKIIMLKYIDANSYNIDIINDFFNSTKGRNIYRIVFESNLNIKTEALNKILYYINYNSVDSYKFVFNKRSIDKALIDSENIFQTQKQIKKSIPNLLNYILKRRLLNNQSDKLKKFSNIILCYVLPLKKKNIEISLL